MSRVLVSACLVACAVAAQVPTVLANDLRAGTAVVDITPPVPFRMSGYFNERLSTGVKDPLYAKAVVFRQGDEAAALAFCDLLGIPLDVSAAARHQASEATGIPAEHIVVAATHSHTGPLYFGELHKYFHERSVDKLGNDPNEVVDYAKELGDKIAAAIVAANAALQPVRLEAGSALEERLSFNRRYQMRNGTVRFNPGQLNPDIVRPCGPIDPQVGIILLKTPNGQQPFAAIAAFAMHCDTTSGTLYSADYPHFVEERLRESFGPDFALMFGAGTCGDINHIDVSTRDVRKPEEIGSMLGDTISQAVEHGTLGPVAEPALAVRSVKVDAPLQSYSADEVATARKNMALIGSRELSFLDQVKTCTIMDLQTRGKSAWPLEVQVFRLDSDTAIVTLPSEIFVELGLAIKAASPFKNTLIVELANDSVGYIPTKKAFAEGSYEICNSRVQPGSGERLVEAATGLLKELK